MRKVAAVADTQETPMITSARKSKSGYLALLLGAISVVGAGGGIAVTWSNKAQETAPAAPPSAASAPSVPSTTLMSTPVQAPKVELLSRSEVEQIASLAARQEAQQTADAATRRSIEVRAQDREVLDLRFQAFEGKLTTLIKQNDTMLDLVKTMANRKR